MNEHEKNINILNELLGRLSELSESVAIEEIIGAIVNAQDIERELINHRVSR